MQSTVSSLLRPALAAVTKHGGQQRWMSSKNGLKLPNVAIAGVTGAVGQEFLELLAERDFPFNNMKMLASARSAGKEMEFKGKSYVIEELTENSFEDVDIALFSAGGSQSKLYAPAAAATGCIVVDNSSAYRMDPDCPLVVPEINPHAIKTQNKKNIIANPNCSTIIMAMPVFPLHQLSPIKRVVCSTYQASSGAGAAAMRELEQQARDWVEGKPYTQDIFGRQYMWNLFSHNSKVDPDLLYNEEEIKMMRETCKIFETNVPVTATCIRVPVLRAHCESINIEFSSPVDIDTVRRTLQNAPGITIIDNPEENQFPEPLNASGKDDVMVGRIRSDPSLPPGIGYDIFIAGDQIRKGAALNAIQIAELLLE